MNFQTTRKEFQYAGRYPNDLLQKRMEELGLNRVDVAKEIGYSPTTIYYALDGYAKKIDVIERLANRLGYRLKITFQPLAKSVSPDSSEKDARAGR